LSIERYSLGFKIRKFISNPTRYLSFMIPYFSYKINKVNKNIAKN
jgi:membrane-associated protease RseP (regulator of RpoE activity)